MKKALSLTLALIFTLAFGVAAFAVDAIPEDTGDPDGVMTPYELPDDPDAAVSNDDDPDATVSDDDEEYDIVMYQGDGEEIEEDARILAAESANPQTGAAVGTAIFGILFAAGAVGALSTKTKKRAR